MLFLIAFAFILASIFAEWMLHLIRENFELEWPSAAGRKAIAHRAHIARMRVWTALD